MHPILNITNGDSAIGRLQAAGVAGDFLPWRDVLHDGPVPAGLAPSALDACRAAFIAAQGWGDEETVARDFAERDRRFATAAMRARVVLWFEHDLYDQLQLLQLLDRLACLERADLAAGDPLLACAGDFYLGEASVDQLRGLAEQAAPVTPAQFELARRAWAAFREPTPAAWCALRDSDTSALPYLHDAIARLIDEYPSCRDGLSRTERIALALVAAGEPRPGRVFAAYRATEPRRFLGDLSFRDRLLRLSRCDPPLLTISGPADLDPWRDATLAVTDEGLAVLAGVRRARVPAEPVRWIGGVALRAEAPWCRRQAADGAVRLVSEPSPPRPEIRDA